jgi:Protein of unknown function (DUF2778)
MWIYVQKTGQLFHNDEEIACGYSGAGACKNEPDQEDQPGRGPIPSGLYAIEAPKDTLTHGPFVLTLEPHITNVMFGRSGFLIHGDSIKDPGTASKGCIILGALIRRRIWESWDHTLKVIPELVTEDSNHDLGRTRQ